MPKRKDRYSPRADGRYCTNVWDGTRDADGKKNRVPLYGKTSKELEEKVDEMRYLVKSGKYRAAPEDITVLEYCEKWITVYKGVKSMNTRRMYTDSLKYTIGPSIGEIKMSKLLASDIQGMINEKKDKYRTCDIALMFIHQVVKRAMKEHILEDDVCEDIEMPPKPKTEKRALFTDEKKAMLQADFELADKVLVYLLYGCGVRRGEALALRVQDFDFKKQELHVENVVVFNENTPEWKEIPKSKDGDRHIPIPDDLLFTLKKYIHEITRGCSSVQQRQEKLLFTTGGGMTTKSSYRKTWDRIIKCMNAAIATKECPEPIQGLTAHIFRHNYATMLYYSEISIKKAAELMGHSDIKLIMEIYAHLDEEKENASNKINDTIKLAL